MRFETREKEFFFKFFLSKHFSSFPQRCGAEYEPSAFFYGRKITFTMIYDSNV